jgi:hypothetical protein
MITITITFSTAITPDKIKFLIEGGVKQSGTNTVEVHYLGLEGNENRYAISSKDGNGLYMAGIVAGQLMTMIG